MYGGEKGIRTLDTFDRIHAFQACSFNHSDTSPGKSNSVLYETNSVLIVSEHAACSLIQGVLALYSSGAAPASLS